MSINNDLGLGRGASILTGRQRNALWKLAVADEPVKHFFVLALAESPEETVRAAPGFAQISRALGLLWPSASDAETLFAKAVWGFQTYIGQSNSFLGAELLALAAKLTEAQVQQALDPVLLQISHTVDPPALKALAQVLLALAPKLTEAQASKSLDVVLQRFESTDGFASTDYSQVVQMLAEALQALPAKLTDGQANKALDPVLLKLGQTSYPHVLQEMAQALRALAPKLTEAQANKALEPVLRQIGQTSNPDALWVLAQALQALPAKLTEAQANKALDAVLRQIGQTTNPDALRVLAEALQALPAKLTDAQANKALSIVFAVGIDPVGSGLVASLAQPGGNVTGLSIHANELAGKRLEFARELVPQLRRLAIMFNVGNAQPVLEMGETQAAARMLGLEVVPVVIQRAEDIAPVHIAYQTFGQGLENVVIIPGFISHIEHVWGSPEQSRWLN